MPYTLCLMPYAMEAHEVQEILRYLEQLEHAGAFENGSSIARLWDIACGRAYSPFFSQLRHTGTFNLV